jgi:hypothetical protein
MITLNRRRKSTYIVHVGLPVMSDGSSLPFLSQVEKLPSSLSATDNPYTNLNSSMCTVHTVLFYQHELVLNARLKRAET